MTSDLTRLREIAEAATAGPWVALPDRVEGGAWGVDGRATVAFTPSPHARAGTKPAEKWRRDSTFIATFHPQAVLELLDRVEAGWQPISTAPRDGKPFLACGGSLMDDGATFADFVPCPEWVGIVSYKPEWALEWRGANSGGHDQWFWHKPTHWQPIPKPPENAS